MELTTSQPCRSAAVYLLSVCVTASDTAQVIKFLMMEQLVAVATSEPRTQREGERQVCGVLYQRRRMKNSTGNRGACDGVNLH